MLTRPDLVLRLEASVVLFASLICYAFFLHGHWLLFAILFLAPDISLLGYLAKSHPRFAAAFYNAGHNYALPALLALAGWKASIPHAPQVAIIWIAHIAFDRLLGFGLKYPEAFKPTHIQTVAVFRATESLTGS